MFRKQHKKDIAQEAVRKRRRATKKPYSRAIVGATLEVIQKKRSEKPEVRDAAREAALREIKERIKKTKDEKKAKKAEVVSKQKTQGKGGNVAKGDGKGTMKTMSLKAVIGGWWLMMVVVKTVVAVDCLTVASLVSSCSDFINNGTSYPYQGSPCCDAMTTLGYLAYADFNLRSLCLCFIGIITAYGSRAAIAASTLPGFCGVSLGFLVDPETDCR
ncbi:hypothetical protein OSB04_026163 [Centaurea solstitialis]|uniref:Bifunctional inhibitor/plant lipid transfer protein/seed storage helical domain-containing protein n=1 Tax=Centaurea solstitialis TaxID=347529 RepID=A0AA38VYH4_9ASTR|nr:hypothetical protein OSB04_026163 [Centaurea solstitialis]